MITATIVSAASRCNFSGDLLQLRQLRQLALTCGFRTPQLEHSWRIAPTVLTRGNIQSEQLEQCLPRVLLQLELACASVVEAKIKKGPSHDYHM